MYKATNDIYDNLHKIDLFLEVRDARIPLASKNFEFDRLLRVNRYSK